MEYVPQLCILLNRCISLSLSCQTELDAQSEVLCGCRIAAGREQGRVGLSVEVKAHGEQLGECIVCHKRELESCVAAAGRGGDGGNIPQQTGLLAIGEIQTQVQVMIDAPACAAIVVTLIIAIPIISFVLAGYAFTGATASSEEIEIIDAVAQTEGPVFANSLIDLCACH